MNETMVVWNMLFPLLTYGLGVYVGWFMWGNSFLNKTQRLEVRYLAQEEFYNVLKKKRKK